MKTIIKQTYQQLKEQPLISIVSIAGTALSLFLIMLVVMIQQVKVASFSPESNRDRMLHVKFGSVKTKDGEEGFVLQSKQELKRRRSSLKVRVKEKQQVNEV